MTDKVDKDTRSRIMSRVRSKDTKPEMAVRRLVHKLGYRYRLHRKDMPGKPDLVFPSRRKIIFVHGCFWHQHSDPNCKRSRLPAANPEYWLPKLRGNAARDEEVRRTLEAERWQVLEIWECQTADLGQMANAIAAFLGPRSK